MGNTDFEAKVREGMAALLRGQNSSVVIDRIDAVGDQALSVSFHLEGEWGGPARFTFPFAEAIPLEESLADLHDLISRSWPTAHLAPPSSDLHSALL